MYLSQCTSDIDSLEFAVSSLAETKHVLCVSAITGMLTYCRHQPTAFLCDWRLEYLLEI
jgi:hypothetical protein